MNILFYIEIVKNRKILFFFFNDRSNDHVSVDNRHFYPISYLKIP